MDSPVYEADDDSYLLLDAVKEIIANKSSLKVLDMGTGSGVIGLEMARMGHFTTLVDINDNAIAFVKSEILKERLMTAKVVKSNFFENVEENDFDIITFNTPYLPNDEEFHDVALHGGKEGFEETVRFLEQGVSRLNDDGIMVILISTLTQPDVVEKALDDLSCVYEVVARKKEFFEELLVYKITHRK